MQIYLERSLTCDVNTYFRSNADPIERYGCLIVIAVLLITSGMMS